MSRFRNILLASGSSIAAGFTYLQFAYPKFPETSKSKVGACRVRFKGSVQAQIYYPTKDQSVGFSYPLFRTNVLSYMAKASSNPLLMFQAVGLHHATVAPVITSTTSPGLPPPNVNVPTQNGISSSISSSISSKLPTIILSHGLYGHCDVHLALSTQLAEQGFIVIVLEHEGQAASYACTEEGTLLTYLKPLFVWDDYKNHVPSTIVGEKEGYEWYLEQCRDFRRPILQKREQEIQRVVQCLNGTIKNGILPLQKDTGLPMNHISNSEISELNDFQMLTQIVATEHCKHLQSSCDMNNLILAGHSFGGATAIVAAQSTLPGLKDAFKCLLLYDPWTECLDETNINQGLGDLPTFSLLSDGWDTNNFYYLTEKLFNPKTTTNVKVATLPGVQHAWVSDVPFWFPNVVCRYTKNAGWMDPSVGLKATLCASLRLLNGDDVHEDWELERLGMKKLQIPRKE